MEKPVKIEMLIQAARAALEEGRLVEAGSGDPNAAYEAACRAAEQVLGDAPVLVRLAVRIAQAAYDEQVAL